MCSAKARSRSGCGMSFSDTSLRACSGGLTDTAFGIPTALAPRLSADHNWPNPPTNQNEKHQVKTREQRSGQIDIRCRRFLAVVAAIQRIGRGQNSRARVERGGDAGFCDGNCLLLHDLVERGGPERFVLKRREAMQAYLATILCQKSMNTEMQVRLR